MDREGARPVTKEQARKQRLQQLATAVTAWEQEQTALLDRTANFARRLLAGRQGAGAAGERAAKAVQQQLARDIDDFLTQ